MRIHWKDEFKEDYKRLETRLKKSAPLRNALFNVINRLQLGENLTEKYTVNRIPAEGVGWYVCYFYKDFILIYKVEGQYVKLSRLGTAKELKEGK